MLYDWHLPNIFIFGEHKLCFTFMSLLSFCPPSSSLLTIQSILSSIYVKIVERFHLKFHQNIRSILRQFTYIRNNVPFARNGNFKNGFMRVSTKQKKNLIVGRKKVCNKFGNLCERAEDDKGSKSENLVFSIPNKLFKRAKDWRKIEVEM